MAGRTAVSNRGRGRDGGFQVPSSLPRPSSAIWSPASGSRWSRPSASSFLRLFSFWLQRHCSRATAKIRTCKALCSGAYGAAIGTILGACILLGRIAIGDWLTLLIGAVSLAASFPLEGKQSLVHRSNRSSRAHCVSDPATGMGNDQITVLSPASHEAACSAGIEGGGHRSNARCGNTAPQYVPGAPL